MPIARSVHEAATAWARTVFGAPRQFADLITAIDVRDEVLERVATEVVRRDVREQRLPSNRRHPEPPRIDPARVDPFEVTVASLRAQSEYVAPCGYCGGGGVCSCQNCGGGGRARCSNCGGSGKEVKYYQKSSRLINCKVCRASGTVSCGGCGGKGSVTCTVCSGSGHQLVWLTYDQESRWTVSIEPQSPVIAAHRQLAEPRFLAPGDLTAFSVVAEEEADGPVMLQGYRGGDGPILRAVVAALDPRLERVNRQQYLKLSIVRRDATYAMSGASGTIVLSGKELVGARTPKALRPIHLRLYLWGGISFFGALGTGMVAAALCGASPYFARSNVVVAFVWLVTIALAVAVVGAVLRALGSRFKLGPLHPFEKYLGIGSVVAFALMVVVGLVSRPTVREVEVALTAGDAARARVVVDALKEKKGVTPEVRDAEDGVMLAEAGKLTGDARLKVLDDVASHHGTRSAEAAVAARKDRLAEIRRLLDAKTPAPVLAAIDRWFRDAWKTDPELAEDRAQAHDLAGTLCSEDPCRLVAANLAKAAAVTPERAQRSTDVRTHLLDGLATTDSTGEGTLDRLKRLRALTETATKSLEAASDDSEIIEKAKKAASWAQDERAKVAMVGADIGVVEELLGAPASTEAKSTWIAVESTRAYLNIDSQKKCRGLYVVGGEKGARTIRGTTWTADRLLSQAVGHAASVKKPTPSTATTSRWFEVSAPVVARWHSGDLVELRVGDAAP